MLEPVEPAWPPFGKVAAGPRQGRRVGDQNAFGIDAQMLGQKPLHRVGRAMQTGRRRPLARPGHDRLPKRAQALGLGAKLGLGRRPGRRPLRQAVARPLWPIDQTRSGQRHLARQPRSLAPLGIAPALDDDRLPLAHALADRGAARLPGLERRLARAEKAVLAEPAVDEGGVELVIDRAHPAEPDLAADRHGVGVDQADLEQAAIPEQARTHAERRRLDHQLETHDEKLTTRTSRREPHGPNRQPSPRNRSTVTASGSPTTLE